MKKPRTNSMPDCMSTAPWRQYGPEFPISSTAWPGPQQPRHSAERGGGSRGSSRVLPGGNRDFFQAVGGTLRRPRLPERTCGKLPKPCHRADRPRRSGGCRRLAQQDDRDLHRTRGRRPGVPEYKDNLASSYIGLGLEQRGAGNITLPPSPTVRRSRSIPSSWLHSPMFSLTRTACPSAIPTLEVYRTEREIARGRPGRTAGRSHLERSWSQPSRTFQSIRRHWP